MSFYVLHIMNIYVDFHGFGHPLLCSKLDLVGSLTSKRDFNSLYFLFVASCPLMDSELENEAEAALRKRRFEAYLRGEIFCGEGEGGEGGEEGEGETDGKEVGEVEAQATNGTKSADSEQDLQNWTCERAVTWILGATNFFEVLGVPPRQCVDLTSLQKRYRKLSLLVHPDKSKQLETITEAQATNAFQRLSEAMRVMVDDVAREKLFQEVQDLERNKSTECMPAAVRRHCWQPCGPDSDDDCKSEDSDTLNEAVKGRVMQQSNLQRLLKRRKVTKSKSESSAGASCFGSNDPTSQWRQVAEAARAASARFAPSTLSESLAPTQLVPDAAGNLTAEQLVRLWQEDAESLAVSGWKRLESRRNPGHFYFAHVATGNTVMEPGKTETWERRQSRHDPAIFYFVNLATGQTSLDAPFEKDVPKLPIEGSHTKAIWHIIMYISIISIYIYSPFLKGLFRLPLLLVLCGINKASRVFCTFSQAYCGRSWRRPDS